MLPRQHASNVGVHHTDVRFEGKHTDSPGGIWSDSGKLLQLRDVVGDLPTELANYLFRCLP